MVINQLLHRSLRNKRRWVYKFSIRLPRCTLTFDDGKYSIKNKDNSMEINSQEVVVFVRGTPTRDSHLDLISELERIGCTCINSRTTISICADKYRSYVRMKDFKLNQPKTVLVPTENDIDTALEELDTKFPIILKTLRSRRCWCSLC